MPITIREATVADVDVILRHRCGMFADMGYGDETAREAMAERGRPFLVNALTNGMYRGWLVEDGPDIVAGGGVIVAGFPPTPLDLDSRRAWVLNVYTEPSHRRRGLARQVMLRIITWCREQGFGSVSLHASDDGRPLYEALGFTPTNEMRLTLE